MNTIIIYLHFERIDMELIYNLNQMQEITNKLPPVPKRIEVTNWLYTKIKQESSLNELIYEKPEFNPYTGIQLRIVSEDEQKNWTADEKKKQFKIVFK